MNQNRLQTFSLHKRVDLVLTVNNHGINALKTGDEREQTLISRDEEPWWTEAYSEVGGVDISIFCDKPLTD